MSLYATIVEGISSFFETLVYSVPEQYRPVVVLFLYTFFIFIYAVFVWKFYRFMAQREIIGLNLSQYDFSRYPGWEKFFAVVLNIIEYGIILPFLVIFWFTVFSVFLLVLSKSQEIDQILLISAAIIASTRVTAYVSENLSKDLAKIFPFTVLALFLLDKDFFRIEIVFEKLAEIPNLFGNILIFLIFIFAIEFILRIIYSFAVFVYSRAEEDVG